MKILLVEDDVNLLNDIKLQFEKHDFQVDALYDGLLAERLAERQTYDCMILDVNIPGKNGFQLCRQFRSMGISTPILLLTAFADIEDKLEGFDAGADDYLTKPFLFQELMARVRSLIKRGDIVPDEKIIQVGDLKINPNDKTAQRGEMPVRLTPREFEILLMMAKARGKPVSKKEIIAQVWGTNLEVNTNTVEVFINLLRSKIDKDQPEKLIHTRLGFGYFLSKE